MDWKLVLDEAAFHYVISLPAVERRKVLANLNQLRTNPNRKPDYQSKDTAGRTLSIWATRPFFITYWLDAFVSEVRVVNINKPTFYL